MFCRKCGYQLDEGASFCVSCGCKLLEQGDQQESQMQLEVLSDKPYLSIHEFIRSPYGSHLRKEYNMIRILSALGILLTVVACGAMILLIVTTQLKASLYIDPEVGTVFVLIGVVMNLTMALAAVFLLARVPKKLTTGSCAGAIVGGFYSVVALFPAIGMLLRVRKIDEEYKRFLYT